MHIAAVHEGRKPHVCQQCGKAFSQRASLKAHIETQHEGKKDFHTCHICGKTFQQKSYLKIHISSVHEGRLDFTCQMCGKSFPFKCQLTKHIAVFHEGKRKICQICGKSFSETSSLNKHISSVHEGLRDYQCQVCDKAYKDKKNLKKHFLRHHGGKFQGSKTLGQKATINPHIDQVQKAPFEIMKSEIVIKQEWPVEERHVQDRPSRTLVNEETKDPLAL